MTKDSIYKDSGDEKYFIERCPFNIKGAPVCDWDGIYVEWCKIVRLCIDMGIDRK